MIFKDANGRTKKLKKAYAYSVDWESNCRSKIQKRVKDLLYHYWLADHVFEEFPVIGTRLTLDFFNATRNIAIEVDGMQHYKYNKHFHRGNKNNFLEQLKRDNYKEQFCERNEIILYRIREDEDVETQLDELDL